VLSYDRERKRLTFESKNYLPIGSELEIITPKTCFSFKLEEMFVGEKIVEVAHANAIVEIPFETEISPNSFLRIKLSSITNGLKKDKKIATI
jgi:hypothetical protein